MIVYESIGLPLLLYACRDAGCPLSRSDFLKWVEQRLSIDLSGDVTLEDAAKALGVWSEEAQEQAHGGQRTGPASVRSETDSHNEETKGGTAV